ncbi:MAG: hypothetical protein JJU34_20085 [Lunatimonas sp.]|uniref:hypothetical protein n=1 Tax=Lunatimonas sp. TaxID=2060141 RepID=UPI00263B9029|nr:hypothetical protein [Lunatimonas sp.]MCC5939590.1 hypothetical protein [Lunatimonas sp.]
MVLFTPPWTNVGELAWMLVRAYLLNGNNAYKTSALALSDSIHRCGFNAESGIWYAGISRSRPELYSDFSYWWIQAYGLMMDLCLISLGDVEHGLLNYLYLSAWVAKEPVKLYFRITEAREGDVLHPLPIEAKDYTVGEVLIDGAPANLEINSNKGIELPALRGARVSVKILF